MNAVTGEAGLIAQFSQAAGDTQEKFKMCSNVTQLCFLNVVVAIKTNRKTNVCPAWQHLSQVNQDRDGESILEPELQGEINSA